MADALGLLCAVADAHPLRAGPVGSAPSALESSEERAGSPSEDNATERRRARKLRLTQSKRVVTLPARFEPSSDEGGEEREDSDSSSQPQLSQHDRFSRFSQHRFEIEPCVSVPVPDHQDTSTVDPASGLSGCDDNDKDRKKQLRMLRNRQSAALSRKRKAERIEHLEQRVAALEQENGTLRRRLEFYTHGPEPGSMGSMTSHALAHPSPGPIQSYLSQHPQHAPRLQHTPAMAGLPPLAPPGLGAGLGVGPAVAPIAAHGVSQQHHQPSPPTQPLASLSVGVAPLALTQCAKRESAVFN